MDREVASLTAALWQLDSLDWRGDYDGWFHLAGAAQFVGIARAEFVRWSGSDPQYAADARLVERIWDSAKPKHGGAFWSALKTYGIKVAKPSTAEGTSPSSLYPAVPLGDRSFTPTRDLRHRTKGLLAWLEREPCEPTLFRVACVFAELVAEGSLKVSVATRLLESACASNGLRVMIGGDCCKQTISNAFRHVEEKLLKPADAA